MTGWNPNFLFCKVKNNTSDLWHIAVIQSFKGICYIVNSYRVKTFTLCSPAQERLNTDHICHLQIYWIIYKKNKSATFLSENLKLFKN